MTEYIDRKVFIEDIKTEIINIHLDGLKGTPRPHDELYEFIDRIKEQPTADVAPVVHGKWVEKPFLLGTTNECSNCNDFFGMPHGKFNYCPNCGAKMDLEEQGKE